MTLLNRKNASEVTEDEEVTPTSTDVSEVVESCGDCISDIDDALSPTSAIEEVWGETDEDRAKREFDTWNVVNPRPLVPYDRDDGKAWKEYREDNRKWREKYNAWREIHAAKYPSYWACRCG